MIRITSEEGTPLRAFGMDDESQVISLHDRYGFVTEQSLARRQNMRKAVGAALPDESARCEFSVRFNNGNVAVTPLRDCQLEAIGSRFKLNTDRGIYFIEPHALGYGSHGDSLPTKELDRRWIGAAALILCLVLIFSGIIYLLPKAQEEEKKPDVVAATPVILKPIVPIKAEVKDRIPPDPNLKSKKTVAKQLGFLGLLGRKDFRKAVGGLPTPAAQTSPGAGLGGTQGSGGELVAGMGRGLHQTTIGSTGVSGLGGIGTKGAGGGQGGYGDTAFGGVGSGVLSAIPLANDATVDEGLDRSQIQATIMRYLSQVRACYEEGLKRNAALIGQVTMNFEVSGVGGVNYARVQRSSLNDRPVEDCISQKMLNWKFPTPRGGVSVKVSYPFMLRPVKS